MKENSKIPKIIHYCWFGKNEFDDLTKKCMESWRKYCTGYKIKEWNEDNFSVEENLYIKEAYQMRKWAFVTDYVRLKVLYEYGGIYMDTDVEVLKPLDNLLGYNAFSGFETKNRVSTATMGACKGNLWIKELIEYYKGRKFIMPNASIDTKTNVSIITQIMKERYSLKLNNEFQIVGNQIAFFPMEYFCAKYWDKIFITENTYTVHHFSGSWLSPHEKEIGNYYFKLRDYMGDWMALKIIGCLNVYHKSGLLGIMRKIKEKFQKRINSL